jgi:multidrug efflux pump subunit AcrB
VIDGTTFSLGAIAGLLAVFGIAVRNGILIGHLQRARRRAGAYAPCARAARASDRLAPILIAAAARRPPCCPSCSSATPRLRIVRPMAW